MKFWVTAMMLSAPLPAFAACPPVPAPVAELSFQSRYQSDDPSRSEIDADAEADAKEALAGLDDFITDLTSRTDTALAAQDRDGAACVMAALAVWADGDALSHLGTDTVQLTLGSRIAALALVAAQVAPVADAGHTASVKAWLGRRMDEQMVFWETATQGAASGNLRAWAGLAGAAVALLTGDGVTRGWAAWSISYVACTANPDGSIPQEMGRKHLALHYQVHAVTALTVAAALLEQQQTSVMARCGRALDRIVAFTLDDLAAKGAQSAAHAGAQQSLNQGFAGLKDFQLAWGEAWLRLRNQPNLEAAIAARRPLKYSKLGGDQSRIWGQLR